jgi:hypothetical protein
MTEFKFQRVTDKSINADYIIPKRAPNLYADLISHLILTNPSEPLTAEEVKKSRMIE